MMPTWYLRMNPRERRLAWIVAGALFLIINLVIWSKLFDILSNARAELAFRKATREEQSIYIKEKDLWAARDKWLKQPADPQERGRSFDAPRPDQGNRGQAQCLDRKTGHWGRRFHRGPSVGFCFV